MLSPGCDGDNVGEQEVEVSLQQLEELVGVGEDDQGTPSLGHSTRETHHTMSDQVLTVSQSHTQVTRLGTCLVTRCGTWH